MPGGRAEAGEVISLRRRPGRPVTVGADTAYVLYTSGSTGHPKGVVISRASLEYFVGWAARALPLSPADQIAQYAPLHFDLPVYDLFVGLTAGACLHLVDRVTAMLPAAVYRLLAARRVSVLYAVPSALNALMRSAGMAAGGLPSLRRVMFAGEAFHMPQLRRLRGALPRSARLFNLYGPIETNVVTWHEVDDQDLAGDEVPIGVPLPGTGIRLWGGGAMLDLRPQAEGEIVVSGPAVSPGYLGDPVRTARTRLAAASGETFYRTGDHARVDGHGRLIFRGRKDDMVKIRGSRVELGEVEAVLTAHPEVAEALVRVRGPDHETALHASVVLMERSAATGPLLRQWLAQRLPAYMVPRAVEVLPRLPVTSTGKLTRQAEVEAWS
jgi:amino acid adenylation domain-containing protein